MQGWSGAHLDGYHAAVCGVLARLLLIVKDLWRRRVLRPLALPHGCRARCRVHWPTALEPARPLGAARLLLAPAAGLHEARALFTISLLCPTGLGCTAKGSPPGCSSAPRGGGG